MRDSLRLYRAQGDDDYYSLFVNSSRNDDYERFEPELQRVNIPHGYVSKSSNLVNPDLFEQYLRNQFDLQVAPGNSTRALHQSFTLVVDGRKGDVKYVEVTPSPENKVVAYFVRFDTYEFQRIEGDGEDRISQDGTVTYWSHRALDFGPDRIGDPLTTDLARNAGFRPLHKTG